MCGFAGFTGHLENSEEVLTNMMNRIIHRGPDSAGQHIDNGAALGFRRLSIIDLDCGSQPMYNETNDIVITFNGEIYNYQDLRKELIEKGHTFRNNSDTEVLIHAYEEYGEDMLNRLRGMFAFVIWDSKKETLFGARDFFGIKPFYYALVDGNLVFASEIKSILEYPLYQKAVNNVALENYLTFQYSVLDETFFKGIYKLMPSHCLTFHKGELNIKRYWEPVFEPDENKTLEECVDEIDKVMHDSVEHHKISDVEVGSFLSSGVDSSYVAAVANVDKTFTVGFGEDEKYNEIGYAKEFSKYIHKENFSKVISPEEYWNSLSKIQYHMDEPLADPAAVALFFVCQIASEKVKAVLSGEGADEIFGGYNIYHNPADMASYFKIPRPIRKAVGAVAEKLPHKHGINYLIRGSKDLDERFIGNAYIFSEKERKDILSIKTNAPDAMAITKPFYDKVRDQDQVTQMQYIDLHLWMTGDILLKADKMSMAHSLELRVPFLDRKVMELAEQIPVKDRVTETETKYAMRLAALQACPPQTAKKKKLGFPVPIRVWLKEDKYYNIVKDKFTSPQSAQFFHTDKLVQLLDDHRAGKYDYSRKIWTVFSFLVWYDVYFSDNV